MKGGRMDIDVLYKIPDEKEIFRHLRGRVHKRSIPLVIYASYQKEDYTNKKVVWNVLPLLDDDGVLAIEIDLYSAGSVMRAFDDNTSDRDIGRCKTIYCQESNIFKYWSYINIGPRFDMEPDSLGWRTVEDDKHLINILINAYSSPGDTILCLGHFTMPFMYQAKRMMRHVVGFSQVSHGSHESVVEVEI
jgi:hypothetical protein